MEKIATIGLADNIFQIHAISANGQIVPSRCPVALSSQARDKWGDPSRSGEHALPRARCYGPN